MKLRPRANYPLDVYYLMDHSKSMEDDLIKLKSNAVDMGKAGCVCLSSVLWCVCWCVYVMCSVICYVICAVLHVMFSGVFRDVFRGVFRDVFRGVFRDVFAGVFCGHFPLPPHQNMHLVLLPVSFAVGASW